MAGLDDALLHVSDILAAVDTEVVCAVADVRLHVPASAADGCGDSLTAAGSNGNILYGHVRRAAPHLSGNSCIERDLVGVRHTRLLVNLAARHARPLKSCLHFTGLTALAVLVARRTTELTGEIKRPTDVRAVAEEGSCFVGGRESSVVLDGASDTLHGHFCRVFDVVRAVEGHRVVEIVSHEISCGVQG